MFTAVSRIPWSSTTGSGCMRRASTTAPAPPVAIGNALRTLSPRRVPCPSPRQRRSAAAFQELIFDAAELLLVLASATTGACRAAHWRGRDGDSVRKVIGRWTGRRGHEVASDKRPPRRVARGHNRDASVSRHFATRPLFSRVGSHHARVRLGFAHALNGHHSRSPSASRGWPLLGCSIRAAGWIRFA